MGRARRVGWWLGVAVLVAAGLGAHQECRAFETPIAVAQATLNLQSGGTIVTVHTEIPYGAVDVSSVFLNDVQIQSWKADSRGYFVAKFPIFEIKDLPLAIGEYNELKLVGLTTGGEAFWGVDEIIVVDIVPAGKR